MTKAAFQAFLFDLDGTLLDTLPDLVVVTNKALAAEGFPARSEPEVLSYVGNGGFALAKQAVPEGTPEEAAEKVFAHFQAYYARFGLELTQQFEGMSDALAKCKAHGLRLGIFSNKFEGGVKDVEARYFPGVFDVAHGERPGIPRKPAPDGIVACIHELGLQPSQCVYFGDSDTDMRAARAAGAYAVGCAWGYQPRAMLASGQPDEIIESPADILRFI